VEVGNGQGELWGKREGEEEQVGFAEGAGADGLRVESTGVDKGDEAATTNGRGVPRAVGQADEGVACERGRFLEADNVRVAMK
jgi:hypothetical protein